MSRLADRISRSFTWRRGVLLVATVAVAIALVERDRRLRAWHAEVAAAAADFVAVAPDGGDVATWSVPGAEVVARDAASAIAALAPPRRLGPVVGREASDSTRAAVVVTGAGGGRVELDWAGSPPRVVAVTRLDASVPSPSRSPSPASSDADPGESP